MTLDEKVNHWVCIADKDISVSELLIKNGHYLHAGFMCQQAVEKIIKGYFIKVKDEVHPHIHNLIKLVERADLFEKLSKEQIAFLDELNPLYIEARYDSYKNEIAETLTDERLESILKRTKEFVQWIKEKMLYQ